MKDEIRHRSISVLLSAVLLICALSVTLSCSGDKAAAVEKTADIKTTPVATSGFGEEKVILPTDDGLIIYGTLVWPNDGKAHPAVILCHQFRSDRGSYKDFQTKLASQGIGSLAIDFRGFGESTDKGLSYNDFKDLDFQNMLKDIKAALVFLNSDTAGNRVDADRIGLAGASIGANLAIMAGAELDGLKCIAALSPGRSYKGLEPLPYAPRVKVPALIAYSSGDKQSADVIPDLIKAFGENKPDEVKLSGSDHGTNMLSIGFDDTLLSWFKGRLAE